MDPIESINPSKDSTLAMLLEGQSRGWTLYYAEQPHLYIVGGEARAGLRPLAVRDDPADWSDLGEPVEHALGQMDVILLRKDPPFDLEYLYTTQILELAARQGALVVNDPAAVRGANEKLFIAWFPECSPPTLATRAHARLRAFIAHHGDVILKPLDSMGGASIFRVTEDDANLNVILETLTTHGRRTIMAQRYIPEVSAGDKRVLLIDGIPFDYALARIPAKGETRANLAAGGQGQGVELSARDRWICDRVGPVLRDQGLLFVGLDVIGDYLTEINVTSPTCIRELDRIYGANISATLLDAIEVRLAKRR